MNKQASDDIPTQRELCRRLGWPWGTFKEREKDPAWPLPKKGPWPAWVVRVLEVWADLRFKQDPDADDPMAAGAASPMLEKWREERWRMARLERLERERTLIPRAEIHAALQLLANRLRRLGEDLQRTFGPDALVMHNECLDDFERQLTTMERTSNGPGDTPEAGGGGTGPDVEAAGDGQDGARRPGRGRHRRGPGG